jgi:biopolymer transport protein ExbD
MKTTISRILIALFAVGLCADVLADSNRTYPQISLVGPSKGKSPVPRDQFVLLVVEGPHLSYDKTPIAKEAVVQYVNNLLKEKNATYLGIYIREGVKYGDVMRALDQLRLTNAESIGVNMIELPTGRDP